MSDGRKRLLVFAIAMSVLVGGTALIMSAFGSAADGLRDDAWRNDLGSRR